MNDFDELSSKAVKRFIRTVAIIDDEATYNENSDLRPPKPSEPLVSPSAPLGTSEGEATPSGSPVPNFSKDRSDGDHRLDAGEVVNSFADMDIVCCVQRPSKGPGRVDRAAKLAAASDVFVIDWDLDQTEKRLARDILVEVLKNDLDSGGRTRLFVVYTAQKNADQMLKDLAVDVKETLNSTPRVEKQNFVVTCQHIRIVVLNKENTRAPAANSRLVSFRNLPEEVVKEFRKLVDGLIPSATLNTIAAMRERTHLLLAILNNDLDGAFCSHRALLAQPADSLEFGLDLITSEIQTVLQSDEEARSCLEKPNIRSWFETTFQDQDKFCIGQDFCLSHKEARKLIIDGDLGGQTQQMKYKTQLVTAWVSAKQKRGVKLKRTTGDELTYDEALNLIEDGEREEIKGCEPPNELRFVEALYEDKTSAESACLQLAALQSTTRDGYQRKYLSKQQRPSLQLGSIVMGLKKEEKVYLCLQPPCDSVRLRGATTFLFLQLTKIKKGKFDLLLRAENGDFLRLALKGQNGKPEFKTLRFSPRGEKDRIKARLCNNQFRFTDTTTNSYRWLAELRREKAQLIANNTAANTSRVGIDEFEWLRRHGTR